MHTIHTLSAAPSAERASTRPSTLTSSNKAVGAFGERSSGSSPETWTGQFDDHLPLLREDDSELLTRQALRRRARARIANDYDCVLDDWAVAESSETSRTARGTLVALMHDLKAKDPITCEHSERVARLATSLTRRLLPEDAALASRVRIAALLHDIGKLHIPAKVLCKCGHLTLEEMDIVRQHPEIGASTLEAVLDNETVDMVLSHHEHIDGHGYPRMLAGNDIPLGGRIIAVVDAYDAMTSNRPYRDELASSRAIEILRAGAGTQWDLAIVDALIEMVQENAPSVQRRLAA